MSNLAIEFFICEVHSKRFLFRHQQTVISIIALSDIIFQNPAISITCQVDSFFALHKYTRWIQFSYIQAKIDEYNRLYSKSYLSNGSTPPDQSFFFAQDEWWRSKSDHVARNRSMKRRTTRLKWRNSTAKWRL